MKNNNPNDEINRLHSEVKKFIEKGYPHESIIEQLQKQGLEPYYIESIIENIKDEQSDKKSFLPLFGMFHRASRTTDKADFRIRSQSFKTLLLGMSYLY